MNALHRKWLMRSAAVCALSIAMSTGGCRRDTPSGKYVPYISGEFTVVYVPPGSSYLNDHSLALGGDRVWHLYATTHVSDGSPTEEAEIAHAVAPSLFGPWTAREPVLRVRTDLHEAVLWAPYVFESGTGDWRMIYWAGWDSPKPTGRFPGLRFASSKDLSSWQRLEPQIAAANSLPGGRDPFVLRMGDRYFLYSVSVDEKQHGRIVVSVSDDPLGKTWSEPSPVLADPVPSFDWGNLESPFVVPYEGQYYLFVTRTGRGPIDYVRTNVFRSPDPRRFEWRPIADLRAHAAEIVVDSGRYYITSSGWTAAIGETNRGLSIAPLAWARESDG